MNDPYAGEGSRGHLEHHSVVLDPEAIIGRRSRPRA